MKILNKYPAIIAVGILGLSAVSSQASELTYSVQVNKSAPEAMAFVPTEESMDEMQVFLAENRDFDPLAEPFLVIDWEADTSIELSDAELIPSRRRIVAN